MANSTVVVKSTGDQVAAAEINNIVTAINSKADQSAISNVDNTSDVNKPISTATATALAAKANQSSVDANTTAIAGKVDKITGKGLSTNDYTSAEKTKLAGLSSSGIPAPIMDSSTTNLNLAYLNATYPTAQAGQFVIAMAANLKYFKVDNSPTGNWDEQPCNFTV